MLGIIINPKSGKSYFRAQRIYLWKLLRKRHAPFAYCVTKFAGHTVELARELVEKGYDEILVLGGDGTLSEAINGIMRANLTPDQRAMIQVGIMPRGTGNDWGRFWGLNKKHKESLHRFFRGQGHPIDIGCLTYWRNGIEHHRYFINSVGFGVDSLCCKKAEVLKHLIGSHRVNYVFGLFAAVAQHKAQHMVLTVDGKEAVDDLLFTMNIGNGPFSGGGIRQNPEADPTDGVFHDLLSGNLGELLAASGEGGKLLIPGSASVAVQHELRRVGRFGPLQYNRVRGLLVAPELQSIVNRTLRILVISHACDGSIRRFY